jgi:hypothetical protein
LRSASARASSAFGGGDLRLRGFACARRSLAIEFGEHVAALHAIARIDEATHDLPAHAERQRDFLPVRALRRRRPTSDTASPPGMTTSTGRGASFASSPPAAAAKCDRDMRHDDEKIGDRWGVPGILRCCHGDLDGRY